MDAPEAIQFTRWKRKPGTGPGHEEIIVYENPKTGEPLSAIHGRKNEIQCATVDRIPFTMKLTNLRAHYKRGTE